MPERYLGRTLGKYRIDELLGMGGFAWVYRGFDPDLEIPVAVKVLKPQFAGDPDFEDRFRREASTAARLRHPNVVTIYAVGREQDAVYFAMDFLPHSLAGRLGVMPTLPGAMLVQVGLDVASALGYAHRQGIIHRDVKPDNILFDDHGNAIVADFGIARAVDAHAADTGTRFVVGTPHYFAPEQARGRPLDGRADIYALGVTLYRAAAGVLPFPGDDWFEVARQHVEVEPTDVRAHNPALSVELARVIHCCLEKDPAERYPSAEELHAALAAVPERGEPSSVRTVTVPALDRIWTTTGMTARRRRLRRRVLLATGSATVVLLAVAFAMARPFGAADAARTDAVAPPGDAPPGAPGTLVLDTAVVLAAADSLVGDSAAADSAAAPPPLPASLALSAPPGARLFVNGQPMGAERWEGRRLAPGRYVVRAELSDAAGCPTARAEEAVTLAAGASRSLRFPLLPCGQLQLNVTVGEGRPLTPDRRGRFDVRGEHATRSGSVPLGAPLLLPTGAYQVSVRDVPRCAGFDADSVHVPPGRLTSLRVPLIC